MAVSLRPRAPLVLVALIVGGAIAACKPADAPPVALLLAAPDRATEAAFAAEATAHDLRSFTRVARDAADQTTQVVAALAAGAKVLVIQPVDPRAAAVYVRLAHERGAKVVAYGTAIESADLDHVVTHDRYHAGVLQAEAAITATRGRGAFVLLTHDATDPAAAEVLRGLEATLAPYRASGAATVALYREVTALPAAHAILATEARISLAASEALRSARHPLPFLASARADAESRRAVCNGTQTLAVIEDPAALARTAVEVAEALLEPREPTPGAASVTLGGGQVPLTAVRVEAFFARDCDPARVPSHSPSASR